MSFYNSFWILLIEKRPALNNPNAKVEIKVSEFESLLKKAYDRGRRDEQREQAVAHVDLFESWFKPSKS